MITYTTQKRKLRDLIPASYNPRKMTEKQNKELKDSLNKFGLAEIPVINTDNTLLAGHQRVRILVDDFGLDHIIDVRVPDRKLTDEECKEYNIRSNKNTGAWDFDVLANEFDLESLEDWGFEQWELGLGNAPKNTNKEVDTEELETKTTIIKFEFKQTEYLTILDDINSACKKLGVETKEDLLKELLSTVF